MSLILATRGIYRPIVAPAPDALVSTVHLILDETEGTAAVDDEGVQNGVYVGSPELGLPAMEAGGGGVGLKDGQHVSVAHNAVFEAAEWAVGFKFMISKALTATGARYGLTSKANIGANEVSFEVRFDGADHKVRAYTTTDAGVARFIPPTGGSLGVGPALSIGTTYSGAIVQRPTGASLYLNAVELATNDVLDGLDNNGADWGIGGYLHPSNGLLVPLNGCIGGWRFFNFAPTGEEIAELPAPQDTIWLRDVANANINEGEGVALDLAQYAHPEEGITAVAGDGDATVTHDTPVGSSLTLDTSDVAVNTAASITAQITKGALTSREATIGLTVLAEADGGDEPLHPSLAEWLVSDQATPSATKFVSNVNRGNGSGSSAANAQAVQAALNAASPGQTFVAVCQTPGTVEHWNFPTGLVFPSGSSGNYITLQARLNDGVVINAGADFIGAATPSSGFWTQSGLSGADIAMNIWRSVGTFSGGAQAMIGWWIEFGHPHQIVRALNMTNLRAAYNSNDSPGGYCGPSVHKDTDGRVYIRMQIPHPAKYSRDNKWSETTWPGHPEAVTGGQLVYPISEDPNDYPIYLTRANNEAAFRGGDWFKIGAGINSSGHRQCVETSHLHIDRGLHYTWHRFIKSSGSGDVREDIFCHRVRCTDGAKIHLSRSEWKFGGWHEGIRSAWFTMFSSNTASGIYCLDCTIGDYHELFVGANNANQFRWRNCTLINIYDDGIQANHNMSRVELGYCYFLNSGYGGMGASGVEGDDLNPGGWFIHHNILDYRQERGTNWRAQPHPGFLYLSHSPDGRSPRKTYNNIFIWGPDLEEEVTTGLAHCSAGANSTNNTLTGAANMHEVFNNMLLRVFLEGTKRYDPVVTSPNAQYSDNFQNRSDFAHGRMIRYSAALTNEMFDYNLYWRSPGMSVNALLRDFQRGDNTARSNYASLSAWRASAEFAHSKLSGAVRGAYAPGFDGNSTDAKPTLATIDDYPASRLTGYRPAPTSAVTVAASSSLSGANWWSGLGPTWGRTYFPWNPAGRTLAPDAWKGPLDPNGSAMTVGVLNP